MDSTKLYTADIPTAIAEAYDKSVVAISLLNVGRNGQV